jgi:tRNA A-37 threonylcarbamoyl transferase component Bud32
MRMQILAARTSAWAAVVEQSNQLIDGAGFRPIKRSARTVAGFIVVDGTAIFVKRVDEGSRLKGWTKRVRGSRAQRVLRGAAMLEAAGFACPKPLAAAEARTMGAVQTSYVISEALDGAHIMSKVVLAGGRGNFRHRRVVLGVVAREIRRLHDAGIYTLDLQETNLMLSGGDGAGWRVLFVDLEDFRIARTVSERRRLLNLVHLDRTIGRYLQRTQKLRFLYHYLGARPRRDEGRRLIKRFFVLRARAQRRAHRHQRPVPATPSATDNDATASVKGTRVVRD